MQNPEHSQSRGGLLRARRRLSVLVPLALLAVLPTCSDEPTGPTTGSLSVAIDGLPEGILPSVTLSGPGAFRLALESPSTVVALQRGTYTIVATDVTSGGVRFAATPDSQAVVVSGGAQARASRITYAAVTSTLVVTVLGLPDGTPATVSVTGPGGFSRTLGVTTSLELLEPGLYTIVASEVQASGKTYRPWPASSSVTLTASTTPAAASVAYGAGNGFLGLTLAGLPSGTDAAITVTGPGGFTRRVTTSGMLAYLEPGSYTIAAGISGSSLTTHTPSPGLQSIDVANGDTSAAAVSYTSSPLQLSLQLLADGLADPVFLTAPDGDSRQFIVERPGLIRIVSSGTLLPTPFLDIRARVNSTGERGLLSVAFDPLYATNGYVYAYYVDRAGDMVVERFASAPGSDVAEGDAGIVITIPHRGNEHHGGLIAFGLDGMLYIGPGDGRCCGDPDNNAQNLGTLLGKMLRIDVRTLPYTIPVGNPFIARAGARAEIWAYGFRNPWRFSFDAPSRRVYIADVGQDAWEEVNVAPTSVAGLNYGWPRMEGTACFSPSSNCSDQTLTLPVLDYPHSQGCSVIGGHVYRGPGLPELTGHYLYSDFCAGWLRSFRSTAGGVVDKRLWAGITVSSPVSFGRDGAGELYMIGDGRVWRIVRQ